jgi:hypothetical protein
MTKMNDRTTDPSSSRLNQHSAATWPVRGTRDQLGHGNGSVVAVRQGRTLLHAHLPSHQRG